MTSNTLSRRYELMVYETVDVREFRELSYCSLCYFFISVVKAVILLWTELVAWIGGKDV
jgi:hypothetical protein